MAAVNPKPRHTFEQYLEMERNAEGRHEYLDGEIFEMSGESLSHSRICTNLSVSVGSQLVGKRCEALSPNMKIRSGHQIKGARNTRGMFSYADLTVVCGEPKFHDEETDVLLNPTVIFEVLSPSTEKFDRGEKLLRYRTHLESLTDYILISQDKPLIEHYQRQADGRWIHTAFIGIDKSFRIDSIECDLRLSDIYDRVEFPPEDVFEEIAEANV